MLYFSFPFYEFLPRNKTSKNLGSIYSRNKNGNSRNMITCLKNLTELEIYVDLEIVSSILDDEDDEHDHGHRGLFPGPP